MSGVLSSLILTGEATAICDTTPTPYCTNLCNNKTACRPVLEVGTLSTHGCGFCVGYPKRGGKRLACVKRCWRRIHKACKQGTVACPVIVLPKDRAIPPGCTLAYPDFPGNGCVFSDPACPDGFTCQDRPFHPGADVGRCMKCDDEQPPPTDDTPPPSTPPTTPP